MHSLLLFKKLLVLHWLYNDFNKNTSCLCTLICYTTSFEKATGLIITVRCVVKAYEFQTTIFVIAGYKGKELSCNSGRDTVSSIYYTVTIL